MDRNQHRAWLAELAVDDLRRRKQAEPELARKEAALRDARENLARSQAVVRELEAELDAHHHPADRTDGGG